MFARQIEGILFWMFVSATNTAFRVSLYVYNSNAHIRKAVYITLQKHQTNKQKGTFERDGEVITIHHCEIMKIVMDYNRYLDRIQHNQPQQGSSSSTKQLSKISSKRETAEENVIDEEEVTLSRFKSAKGAIAKSETEVVSLLDDSE